LILAVLLDREVLMLPVVRVCLGYQRVQTDPHLLEDLEDQLVLLLQRDLELHHSL